VILTEIMSMAFQRSN